MREHPDLWVVVKHPRRWFPGMRVIGVVNPSGREYRQLLISMFKRDEEPLFEALKRLGYKKMYPGVLIKNEYSIAASEGYAVKFPCYTVKCDDGKIRKFQRIYPE